MKYINLKEENSQNEQSCQSYQTYETFINEEDLRSYQEGLNEIEIKPTSKFKQWLKKIKEDFLTENTQKLIFKYKLRSDFGKRQWFKYYLLDHDLTSFIKLIKCYGVPDLKNDFIPPDPNYYKYHQDFLFCKEIEMLFSFFIENMTRRKEIAYHYDLFQINKEKILFVEKLKDEIEEIKKNLQFNYETVDLYFNNKIDKEEKIDEKVFSQYDETQQQLLNKYVQLTEQYNKLLTEIPNDFLKINDKNYFQKIINSANMGLIILNYGDKISSNALEVLDEENLYFFFVLSILLSDPKIWLDNKIDNLSLKNNIQKMNKNSLKTIFFEEMVDSLIELKKKETENEEYYWKNLVNSFELEDFLFQIEILSKKHLKIENRENENESFKSFNDDN